MDKSTGSSGAISGAAGERTPTVDSCAPDALRAGRVVGGRNAYMFDKILACNTSKFCRLQLVATASGSREGFFVVFRWGRVGEAGLLRVQEHGCDLVAAERAFDAKFKSKTGNTWEAAQRGQFQNKCGKYGYIEEEGPQAPPAARASAG